MRNNYLELGQIVGTHGVVGEMRLNPWCDGPDFVKQFNTLYYDPLGDKPVKLLSARTHGNVSLIKLEGTDSVEKAQAKRGTVLYIKRDDAKLAKGVYFISELFGCAVENADTGESYGVISDVSETGANDVWHIKRGEREYLIPAIKDVVVSVDIDGGMIKIRPMKGIFDDAD